MSPEEYRARVGLDQGNAGAMETALRRRMVRHLWVWAVSSVFMALILTGHHPEGQVAVVIGLYVMVVGGSLIIAAFDWAYARQAIHVESLRVLWLAASHREHVRRARMTRNQPPSTEGPVKPRGN